MYKVEIPNNYLCTEELSFLEYVSFWSVIIMWSITYFSEWDFNIYQ